MGSPKTAFTIIGKVRTSRMKNKQKQSYSYASLKGFHRAVPIILAAVAVFTGLCFVTSDIGAMGNAISGILLGLFSFGAYFIPFLIALHALFYPADLGEKRILSRAIFSLVTVIFISAFIYAVSFWGKEMSFSPGGFYSEGKQLIGGGFIGSMVAYGLIKIFGSAGVVVIAAAIFAIYLSYFFAGSKNSLKRVGLGILRAVVSFFAFFERGFKRIFTSPKKRRDRRLSKESKTKTALLAEDEFFGVDNGMKRLEISELGIKESKDSADAEANPTLDEKVYHKSNSAEGNSYEGAENATRTKRTVSGSFFDGADGLADSTAKRSGDQVVIVLDEDGKKLSDNAEDVFTKEFDPYDIMKSESLARKASSRSVAEGKVSVTENISNITPEELERARRIAEFERRKKAVVDAARRKEAVPVTNSGEYSGEAKHVAFTEQKTDGSAFRETEGVSVVIDKQEHHETSYTDAALNSGFNFTKEEEIYSVAKDNKPESSASGTSAAKVDAEEEDAVKIYSAPKDEGKDYISLLSDTEQEERSSIRIERSAAEATVFADGWVDGSTLSESDTDEDTEDYGEDGELVSLDGEEDGYGEEYIEIPPEKQNPDVLKAREMFSFFKDEEDTQDDGSLDTSFTDAYSDDEDYTYGDEDGEESDGLGFGSDEDEEYGDDEDEEYGDEDYSENINAKVSQRSGNYTYEEEEDSVPFDIDGKTKISSVKVESAASTKSKPDYKDYVKPPLELLKKEEHHDDEETQAEINENTRVLIETLQSFNVTASIKGVDRGPRITRYEVVPARGVKVGQITHLFDDIKLYLAAEGIRMEAPIPGKSAIGFEIPNKNPVTVRLRELLECEEFINAKSKTFVCIGKDVAGFPVFGDISKFPHALVAGATGMGKSVCINSLLISMLYKARPDEVKFIMIDPKKVEFKMYSGIPHLLIPVITEAKQAAGALMWAVEEMERRYEFIEQNNIRNIEAYNEKVALDPSLGAPMPKIVIVIDELNDLMMQVRDPVEGLIMRIAQKARAAGIHLIIGTQRPDVKVITGTIKANINTRLSCKVTSVTDSRTILEMAGAEKLLDKGDMLFKPVDRTKPIRVQSAFVSDGEVEDIMNFLKSGASAQYDEEIFAEINKAAQKCNNNKKSQGGFEDDMGADDACGYYNDQQFLDAVELAIRSGKVSTSLLQRRLSIGYGKAAKYIDGMQELGVVSEPNGNKPREILMSLDEWFEKLSRVSLD